MDQNGLIILLRTRILEAMDENGWTGFDVVQKHQPTQQGAPVTKGVFIQPLFDTVYGWHGRKNEYDQTTDDFNTKEPQSMETHFQISCLVIQDPDVPLGHDNPTSADVVKYLSRALTSGKTIKSFRSSGVSILRPRDVKNDPFMDDRDRSEYHASFDLILTHSESYSYKTPKINRIDGDEYTI